MNTFKKSATALAITLSLATTTVSAEVVNLVNNGDFELADSSAWVEAGGTPSIITDATLSSQVLKTAGRTKASSAAKYTLAGLIAGHTYKVTAKIKSDSGSVGFGLSFRGDPVNGDPLKDTFLTVGGVVLESAGAWKDFDAEFSLPASYDNTVASRIWLKTDTDNASNTYLDDIVIVDLNADPNALVPSRVTDADSFTNTETDYWTGILAGKQLDVMRLSVSDSIKTAMVADVDDAGEPIIVDGNDLIEGSSTQTEHEVIASFELVEEYFADNVESGWRWPTKEELVALQAFYAAGDNDDFLAINGGAWSPKEAVDGTQIWHSVIPGEYLPDDGEDHTKDVEGNTAWKFTVKDGKGISPVVHGHSFNSNGLAAAPIIVRDVVVEEVPTELTLTAPADVAVEATGAATTVTLGSATVAGGTNPLAATNDLAGALAVGAHTVTWTVFDELSATAEDTQSVTVTDSTGPVFPVLADLSFATIAEVVIPEVSTTDLVDGAISATNDAAETLVTGDITWTATDAAGNTSTATQKLIIGDAVEVVLDDPTAAITGTESVVAGENITLSAATSTVDASLTASYTWSVTSGEGLTLTGDSAEISVAAPMVEEDTTFVVTLTVSDGSKSTTATHTITLTKAAEPEPTPDPTPEPESSGGSFGIFTLFLGLLGLGRRFKK
jgi:hypothetical protein